MIWEAYEGSTADGETDCVEVEQEYILSGVLKEYTKLWLSGQDISLPGAVITKKAAEQVYEKAVKERADPGLTLNDPQKIYFLRQHPEWNSRQKKHLKDIIRNSWKTKPPTRPEQPKAITSFTPV